MTISKIYIEFHNFSKVYLCVNGAGPWLAFCKFGPPGGTTYAGHLFFFFDGTLRDPIGDPWVVLGGALGGPWGVAGGPWGPQRAPWDIGKFNKKNVIKIISWTIQ